MVQIGKKTWRTVGQAVFSICTLYITKTCEHSRSHIFGPIFMKFGQNVCLNDMLVEFKSGSGPLKNMAASGRGSLPYLAKEKPCKHSRGHISCPIFMKLGQKICPNDTLIQFQTGSCWVKNLVTRSKKRKNL